MDEALQEIKNKLHRFYNDNYGNQNNIVVFSAMEELYRILVDCEDHELQSICNEIFTNDYYDIIYENGYEKHITKNVADHFCRVFRAMTISLTDSDWGKRYYPIVNAIYTALGSDSLFLYGLEEKGDLAQSNIINMITSMPLSDARAYFNLLYDNKCYKAAITFLKYYRLVPYNIFEEDTRDYISHLNSLNHTEFANFAYELSIKENSDYSILEWAEDVKKSNENPSIVNWASITAYYSQLAALIKMDASDTKSINELLDKACEYEMFIFNKTDFLRILLEDSSYVLNTLILSHQKELVLRVIDELDRINIASYRYRQNTYKWIRTLETLKRYPMDELLNIIVSEYDKSDAISIYLNSSLRVSISLYTFIERLNIQDLSEYFKDYTFSGNVMEIKTNSSIADKIKIKPLYIGLSNNQENSFRSSQNWYTDNKRDAELLKNRDYVNFKLNSFHNNIIYLSDISLSSANLAESRKAIWNSFPAQVNDWLKEIIKTKAYTPWKKNTFIFSLKEYENSSIKNEITYNIVAACHALSDSPTLLEAFIRNITTPPAEALNECRNINVERSTNVFLNTDSLRESIIKMTDEILGNRNIPADLRKDVFINTSMRKYYDLRLVFKRYPDVAEFFKPASPDGLIILCLKLESKDNDQYYFEAKGNGNRYYSISQFVYNGSHPLINENESLYFVSIKDYDPTTDTFIIHDLWDKSKIKEWDDYVRLIFDLKRCDPDDSRLIDSIKRRFKKSEISITKDYQISQFSHELNLIFIKHDFDLKISSTFLQCIVNNPFADYSRDFSDYSEVFSKRYINTYNAFLNRFKDQPSPALFCKLFFNSFLKATVDYNKFFDDIAADESTRQRCKKTYNL